MFRSLGMKNYLLLLLGATLLANCDVRRKDRIADDALVKEEKLKKELVEKREAALKDTTTVQLIDSFYNFGKVRDGAQVEYSFKFKNTGNNPLVVMDAHASCGCTVPEKPEQPIKPGETGVIKVVFNSKGRSGHQEKTITVNSNARPEFGLLKLTGEVE